LISNIYTWIFLAAVFSAAGLSNFSSSVKRKRNPERARRNRIVWFSINISIVFVFFGASVFYVNWQELVLSPTHLYFSIFVFGIFYTGFIFKYIIGLPLIFIFAVIILLFNIYLQNWQAVPSDGILAKYRILSNDISGFKAEISEFDTNAVFIKEISEDLILEFELLEIDKTLFFIESENYYRFADSLVKSDFPDNLIDYISLKTIFLSGKKINVNISNSTLLHQYNILYDWDNKKIVIDN
jgi:hypothetical protein